ncbi:MAG TPA: Uma2 family endonuclease [Thermoanaerobaculia bacterium]|nr:Uma2 family endonuclease [Thermoanaerobaculia bacterium]
MSEGRGPASYQDVLNAPDDRIAEIVSGELFLSPRPAIRHARISSILGGHLVPAFDSGISGPGGWWILFEPELHLGADVLVPDLAGWRRERLAALPDQAAMTVTPDWVCEVLSPATAAMDRERKLPLYAKYEVESAWLIDAKRRSLEVYVRESGGWRVAAVHDDRVPLRAYPFDAVAIDLRALWID